MMLSLILRFVYFFILVLYWTWCQYQVALKDLNHLEKYNVQASGSTNAH